MLRMEMSTASSMRLGRRKYRQQCGNFLQGRNESRTLILSTMLKGRTLSTLYYPIYHHHCHHHHHHHHYRYNIRTFSTNTDPVYYASSLAKAEHDKRVAAARALVLEQRQRSTTSSTQQRENAPTTVRNNKKQVHHTSSTTNASETTIQKATSPPPFVDSTNRHILANNVQHWFSKDITFFARTMQALNLNSLSLPGGGGGRILPTTTTTTTITGSDGFADPYTRTSTHAPPPKLIQNQQDLLLLQQQQQPNQHPLQLVLTQYRQLYYESIPDFKRYVESGPESLQPIIQQLVNAGFGNPSWSKKFRQARTLQQRHDQVSRQISKQQTEYNQRKQLLQQAEQQLVELQALEKAAQQKIASLQAKRQREREERLQQLQPRSQQAKSVFGTVWSNVSSMFHHHHNSSEKETASVDNIIKDNLFPAPSLPTTSNDMDPNYNNSRYDINNDNNSSNDINKDNTTIDGIEAAPVPSRLKKRLTRKQDAVRDLTRNLQDLEQTLRATQAQKDSLQPLLPQQEYEAALSLVQNEAREILCQELACQMQERHAHLIEQYQRLDAKTDLTKPQEWFGYARLDRRKIIFHGGPTNSGKTYNALMRLKQAKKGLYLGPLRLLAAEVYDDLTADGFYTNLFTGQERREIAFSTHAAGTVEMVNMDKEYDVVVIDEIQMISDVTRGAAWTKALLGLRCKEIHVCGGLEAKNIVEKLAHACGDDFELNQYERFSPLKVASRSLSNDPSKPGGYRNVQPGDCVVAFSRNDIFAIKREIESMTNYKCCVIYGKLPPQTRADQARRFNDPNSGYDILVASDAIGMGLNLNIKRIIFNTIFKFNGEEVIRLSHSDIKQIAGRAGRRNSPYPHGEVTCRDPRDLPYVRQCLSTEIAPIEKAALLPTAAHIELFSEGLQAYDVGGESMDLHQIFRQYSAMATVKGDYFLGRQTEMRIIAKKLKGIPVKLRDAYTLCLSPTSENSLHLLQNFAWKLSRGEVFGLPSRSVPKQAKSFDDLSYLCGIYADADLFLWLQFKFPPSNAVEHQAALARKEKTLEFINEALSNTEHLKLNHCYIKTANRNRARYESENGPGDEILVLGDTDPESDEYEDDHRMEFDDDMDSMTNNKFVS